MRAGALVAPAGGDLDAARAAGSTADGDERRLTFLFDVLQPGDPVFDIVLP